MTPDINLAAGTSATSSFFLYDHMLIVSVSVSNKPSLISFYFLGTKNVQVTFVEKLHSPFSPNI
jgi:hypothetical protein